MGAKGAHRETSDGTVVWVTGLPSSGKSTLAASIADRLRASGRAACVLDGDEVRAAITPRHGYDEASREAFYATLAALASLVAKQGLVTIVPATANRQAYREHGRRAAARFIEVFVDVDPSECQRRDAKGLYERGVSSLPGVDAPYERPIAPDVVASGGLDGDAVDRVVELVGRGEGGA